MVLDGSVSDFASLCEIVSVGKSSFAAVEERAYVVADTLVVEEEEVDTVVGVGLEGEILLGIGLNKGAGANFHALYYVHYQQQ
mmetsp:Transcript_15605/g.23460  ORF Transcript_15605/g.23460 Transcript_15605/m.23460 type:complete len:83 (+) Transcript_15605:1099-1347(+)